MEESLMRRHFEQQGFHVRDGLKYGVDLLLYTDAPEKVHSKYAVLVDRHHTFLQIMAIQRVCSSSRKVLVMARYDESGGVVLVSIERFVGRECL